MRRFRLRISPWLKLRAREERVASRELAVSMAEVESLNQLFATAHEPHGSVEGGALVDWAAPAVALQGCLS